MSLFGLGEVSGAFFSGFIIDWYGSKANCIANFFLLGATMIFTLEFLFINDYNALVFLMTFLHGV